MGRCRRRGWALENPPGGCEQRRGRDGGRSWGARRRRACLARPQPRRAGADGQHASEQAGMRAPTAAPRRCRRRAGAPRAGEAVV